MARAVPVAAGATDVQALTGTATVVGFALRETGTAAGGVQLRDGTSAAGPVIAVGGVATSGSVYIPVPAVDVTTGVFVDRSGTGVTELVLYVL